MRWNVSVPALTQAWRLLLVRSIALLGISLAALPWPNQTLSGFVVLTSSIVLVSGLLDAALFGALHRSTKSAWVLLWQALVSVALTGALLLYPLVPLTVLGVLLAVWAAVRGGALLLVAHDASRDRLLRTLSLGWGAASLLAVVLMLAQWGEVTMLSIAFGVVAYGLLWGALELAIALHLRARAQAGFAS